MQADPDGCRHQSDANSVTRSERVAERNGSGMRSRILQRLSGRTGPAGRRRLLGVGTAALVIASMLGGPLAAPASASAVTNVNVALANNAARETTYTITFTATTALAAGDTITLMAPVAPDQQKGTVFPADTAGYDVNGNPPTSVTGGNGQQVTLTLAGGSATAAGGTV